MTDVPRPADEPAGGTLAAEPDREALRERIANALSSQPGVTYGQWDSGAIHRAADAVLALLPTQPAPGGEDGTEPIAEATLSRFVADTPGGGGTDLRGEAVDRIAPDEPGNVGYRAIAAAGFDAGWAAALAARDTDQGAGMALDGEAAARALHRFGCEACHDGAPCPYDGLTDWDITRAEAVVRAALARATPEAGS